MSSAAPPARWFDICLTAAALLTWGSTYLVTTEFLPPDVPLLSATLRTLPVGLLMLLCLRQLPPKGWWGKIFLLGMLNIGIFQALLFETLPAQLSLANVFGYIWLGLIGTGLTYVFWLRGVMKMPAAAVTTLSLLSPLSATVLGAVVLQQKLTLLQSAGMALVLLGVWLGQRSTVIVPASAQAKLKVSN